MSYTPFFGMMVDSSVWEEALHVRVLWVTMLLLQERGHVVRYDDPYKLAKRSNLTIEQVVDGLKVLSNPDRRKPYQQEHDGRRITRVEDGWLILNGEKYQKEFQRINNCARVAKCKAKKKVRLELMKEGIGNGPLPGERDFGVAYGDGDDGKCDDIVTRHLPEGRQ